MSYIRCISNPEGLYIWHDFDGDVKITWSNVKPPLSYNVKDKKWPIPMMSVPVRVFQSACKKWDEHPYNAVNVKGFTVEEIHVNVKTGKRIKEKEFIKIINKVKSEFLVRIAYKKKFVYLWPVTWDYVVNSALRQ
jgi:hypothetical protein